MDKIAIDEIATKSKPYPLNDRLVHVALPQGTLGNVIDLELTWDRPERKRGTFSFYNPDSFGRYWKDHADEHARIYADLQNRQIVGILNPHLAQQEQLDAVDAARTAGWHDHRMQYALRPTSQWMTWAAANGDSMDQRKFAQFIEDNSGDIAKPDHAKLIEIALTFTAKKNIAFRSAERLLDGTHSLEYAENVEAGGGKSGKLALPEQLQLSLKPFEGSPTYRVDAWLRYELTGHNLRLHYKLIQPHVVIETAFADVLGDVERACGDDKKPHMALHGAPPADVFFKGMPR